MSSSFQTEPSFTDNFNLLPTRDFLEAINNFYVIGSNPDIMLDNGTLANGTFVATFTGSLPVFEGNTNTGVLYCLNNQEEMIGDKVFPLTEKDIKMEYGTLTASYNLLLNKRFPNVKSGVRSFGLGIDSGSKVDLLFVGEIQQQKLKSLAPMKDRFLSTFENFFETNSDYTWYGALATMSDELNIDNQNTNFVILNSSSDFIDNAITQGGTLIGSGVGSTEPGYALAQHHIYNNDQSPITILWNESAPGVTNLFNETSFSPSNTDLLYNTMFIFGTIKSEDSVDTLVAFAGVTPKTGILPYSEGENKDESLIDYYAFYPIVNIQSSDIIII
jgi:hypothetical protein